MNAIAYKNVFPLIKNNKLWLGCGKEMGNKEFRAHNYDIYENNYRIDNNGSKYY